MKRFFGVVFDKDRINGLAKISLLCVFWWIAQTVASVIVLKLFSAFTHTGSESWSAIDRLSPVPHFLTSLSSIVMVFGKGLFEILAPLSVVTIQFVIFTVFTWFILKMVAKLFAPERKISFSKHFVMAVALIPVFLSISLLARFVQIPLDHLSINSSLKFLLSQFVPDLLSIGLMSVFFNSFLFVQLGFSVPRSIFMSLQSTSRNYMVCIGVIFSITLFSCAVCTLFFTADSVLNGLYEPFKYAISGLGWVTIGLVWIYTGSAYHDYVESERLEPLPASKGA